MNSTLGLETRNAGQSSGWSSKLKTPYEETNRSEGYNFQGNLRTIYDNHHYGTQQDVYGNHLLSTGKHNTVYGNLGKKHEGTGSHQEASGNHHAVTGCHQEVSRNHQAVTGSHQEVSGNHQAVTGRLHKVSGRHRDVSGSTWDVYQGSRDAYQMSRDVLQETLSHQLKGRLKVQHINQEYLHSNTLSSASLMSFH